MTVHSSEYFSDVSIFILLVWANLSSFWGVRKIEKWSLLAGVSSAPELRGL